ncbi:MAG: L-serine ammonia-lyase, iron-sulfur-dependent subunit beta [Phascolarctobacterium sp.]|nr:L-serine ammonia-lyase, iron-sulfur-dependent subunit beta [Phascolarctobacterium sp.]
MNLIDVIGPVMIGPSSSHTAGAARLGLLAASILGSQPVKAELFLHGSFAETHKGHGTDLALIAGLMGWAPDDERIPESFEYAKNAGLDFCFQKIDLGTATHPNTVLFKLTANSGRECEIVGSSIGGGQVLVSEIDGFPVELSGRLPALITNHEDKPGIISVVSTLLANMSVNIATMRVFRTNKGGLASMVIECDNAIDSCVLNAIGSIPAIRSIRFVDKVL